MSCENNIHMPFRGDNRVFTDYRSNFILENELREKLQCGSS